MSKIRTLKGLVNGRLTAATDEIFLIFEASFEGYEGEVLRARQELECMIARLDAVLKPEIKLSSVRIEDEVREILINLGDSSPGYDGIGGHLQLPVCKEGVPHEQQERSPSLDQEEPELLQIKEEQEELWTSQEGEQLQGPGEADIKLTSTPVPVKSEHDEEKPHSLWFNQTHEHLASTSTEQMETEPDGKDCGVSEPARDGQLLSPDWSETEMEDSDDYHKVNERLNTVAKEICGIIKRTIKEYQGDIYRAKQEIDHHRHLLDLAFKPVIKLGRAVELWTSLEGEQLQGLEEADIIKLTSTHVPVKSEHDEEKPQSLWFNETQTEPLASTSTDHQRHLPDLDFKPVRELGREEIMEDHSSSELERMPLPVSDDLFDPKSCSWDSSESEVDLVEEEEREEEGEEREEGDKEEEEEDKEEEEEEEQEKVQAKCQQIKRKLSAAQVAEELGNKKKVKTNGRERPKKKCPVEGCYAEIVNLPRHLCQAHKWSKEAAAKSTDQFERRSVKARVTKPKWKDFHRVRSCPVKGCKKEVKQLPQHLMKAHKIKRGSRQYLQLLKIAHDEQQYHSTNTFYKWVHQYQGGEDLFP